MTDGKVKLRTSLRFEIIGLLGLLAGFHAHCVGLPGSGEEIVFEQRELSSLMVVILNTGSRSKRDVHITKFFPNKLARDEDIALMWRTAPYSLENGVETYVLVGASFYTPDGDKCSNELTPERSVRRMNWIETGKTGGPVFSIYLWDLEPNITYICTRGSLSYRVKYDLKQYRNKDGRNRERSDPPYFRWNTTIRISGV